MTALAVLAKAPEPGRSKTRLSPPCTPEEAAQVADAALRDTLDVVGCSAATRLVLVLDGGPLAGVDERFEVIGQHEGGLGDRLAGAFADVGEPMLLVGMDTPQATVAQLDDALARVDASEAVLGEAADGGWWALGLPACPPGAFDDVPMSTSSTHQHQVARLRACGVDPQPLPVLSDVDHWDEAVAVARQCPAESRFARVVLHLDRSLPKAAP